jgi:hypothetical protein
MMQEMQTKQNAAFYEILTSIDADGLLARSFSLRISVSMHCLMASLHARWQISVKSAPEKPCVTLAI